MEVLNKDELRLRKEDIFDRIEEGVIFIHPTDTIYGIGCDATNYSTVKKVRELKERHTNPFSVIAPSKEWIIKNCELNNGANKWLNKLPGPYTFILKLKNQCVASNVNNNLGTLGIRIPAHWFSDIVKEIKKPIVTTSANITGNNFMTSLENLNQKIKNNVDFMIYEGEKHGRPSKIVELINKPNEIIR